MGETLENQLKIIHRLEGRESITRFPCWWCGTPTTSLDYENFHSCRMCQRHEIAIGFAEMKKRHPNAGLATVAAKVTPGN